MTMDNPTVIHTRRVDDLIKVVQDITQKVDDYLNGRMNVKPHDRQQIQNQLAQEQAMAVDAMNVAIQSQQSVLKGMDMGIGVPQRRATDPNRIKPNLKTVEDLDIDEIKRLSGITEEESFEPKRVFHMIGMMAKEAMAFSSPYMTAQRIISLAQKIKR